MFKKLKIGRKKNKSKKKVEENCCELDWYNFQPVVNGKIPKDNWYIEFLDSHNVAVLRYGHKIIEPIEYDKLIWKNVHADMNHEERPFTEDKIWEYIYQKVREFTSDVIYIRLEDLFKTVGDLSQKDATNLMYLANSRDSSKDEKRKAENF